MSARALNMKGEDGVKSISALLAGVGVPSVLWGEYLINVYGVPSLIGVSGNMKSTVSVPRLKIVLGY